MAQSQPLEPRPWKSKRSKPGDHERRKDRGADPATEEDLQARDAGEMPNEPQNPVNPKPDTAT